MQFLITSSDCHRSINFSIDQNESKGIKLQIVIVFCLNFLKLYVFNMKHHIQYQKTYSLLEKNLEVENNHLKRCFYHVFHFNLKLPSKKKC